MQILGFLATPLGYVMQFLYNFIGNYGWALILFTVLVRLIMFPIMVRQQKTTARNAAYQPMIQEIQKKWAKDRNKANEEVMKFQQENGIKLSAGCLPLVLNMVVLFSVIEVIYRPLTYILQIPADVLARATELVQTSNNYTTQSTIIGQVMSGDTGMISALGTEWAEKVAGFDFEWLGLNLSRTPAFDFSNGAWVYLLLPVLSLLTMLLSQVVTMRTSGQAATQGRGTMIMMTVVMFALFGTYAFTVPVAFSLYYAVSNILMLVQQVISKKIYDPEKIRAEVLAEIEERKKAKKAKKVVKVKDESGALVEAAVSDADLAKLRLAEARKRDAERYAEEQREIEKNAALARERDAEKYEKIEENSAEKSQDTPDKEAQPPAQEGEETLIAQPEAVKEQPEAQAEKQEYKPGRRKRAKEKKEQSSFVEQEQKNEGGADNA